MTYSVAAQAQSAFILTACYAYFKCKEAFD